MRELEGKVAVVTGGGSGIGAAIVRALAAEGMAVVAADIELAAAEADYAAGEFGLDQVRGIHRAVTLAGTDKLVHLVDEQDHLAIATLHLLQDGFQPFLEFAAIFRSGNQGAHIKRH